MNSTAITYKLRAETVSDLRKIKKIFNISIEDFKVVEPDTFLGDLTATFKSSMNLRAIQRKIGQVPDCHVALQTVQPIELYTGERDYDLEVETLDQDVTTLSQIKEDAVLSLDVRSVLGEKYVIEIKITTSQLDDMLTFYGKKSKDELKIVYKNLLKDCAVISNYWDYEKYYIAEKNYENNLKNMSKKLLACHQHLLASEADALVCSKWRRDVLSMGAVRYHLLGVTPVVNVMEKDKERVLNGGKNGIKLAWEKIVSHIKDKNYNAYSKDVAVFHLTQPDAISTPEFVGLNEDNAHKYYRGLREGMRIAIVEGHTVIPIRSLDLTDTEGNTFYAIHAVHDLNTDLNIKDSQTSKLWYKYLFDLDVKVGEILIFKGEKRRNRMYDWLMKPSN